MGFFQGKALVMAKEKARDLPPSDPNGPEDEEIYQKNRTLGQAGEDADHKS